MDLEPLSHDVPRGTLSTKFPHREGAGTASARPIKAWKSRAEAFARGFFGWKKGAEGIARVFFGWKKGAEAFARDFFGWKTGAKAKKPRVRARKAPSGGAPAAAGFRPAEVRVRPCSCS